MNIYKENHDQLRRVATEQFTLTDDGKEENKTVSDGLYGDSYCTDSNRCLRNLTLADIDKLCDNCAENATMCRFYATWK